MKQKTVAEEEGFIYGKKKMTFEGHLYLFKMVFKLFSFTGVNVLVPDGLNDVGSELVSECDFDGVSYFIFKFWFWVNEVIGIVFCVDQNGSVKTNIDEFECELFCL